jgi:lipoprotein-anchoring transpeptidase ErfK/SrfK
VAMGVLGGVSAVVLAAGVVRGDAPLPPWIGEGQLGPPAWARSVAPKAGERGRPGDLVLFAGASSGSARRGVTAPGATLGFFGSRRGSGCSGTWWLVGPMAWTCSDDAALSPVEPTPVDATAPTDAFPAQYFFVGRAGASAYASIESAAEGAPDRELEGGWAVAVVEQRDANGARWAKTSKGLFIAVADLVAARPSEFRGEAIEDGRIDMAWVLADRASVFPGPSAKGKPETIRARFQLVHVREENGPMVRVDEGAWMIAKDLSRPSLAAPPTEVTRPGERWIDVDTATQTLVAYEGARPVFATLVSTGRLNDSPTPPGVHRIWAKLVASTMGNVASSDADPHYSLEDVPYVQFFDNGVALHGTYWHQDFGHARSHGCVNLAPLDARRLFGFTAPRLGSGWVAAYPIPVDEGTLVRVK